MVKPRTRRLLLLADAAFGVLLLVVAFWGAVPRFTSPTAPPASAAPATVAARFGPLMPPAQSTGFAVAVDGGLGVVDRARSVVVRLDAAGQPIAEWGPRFGDGLDAQDLQGLAADRDGWYLLDRGASRILRLDAAGRADPARTIDLQPLGTYGPNGLAIDAQGRLYVADTGRDRILVFESGGRLIRTLGVSGVRPGDLKQPMALAFGPDGAAYVSDWENSRVVRYDAAGTPTAAWPVAARGFGIAVDRLGRVYVPDTDRGLVRVYGADGSGLFQLGDPAAPLPIESPSQVAVSPDGATLWVLGSRGLAKVDLSSYAGIVPDSSTTGVRVPLAVTGVLLIALAAALAMWPTIRVRRARSGPADPAPFATAVAKHPAAEAVAQVDFVRGGETPRVEQNGHGAPASTRGRGRTVLLGVGLLAAGAVGGVVAMLRLTDPLAVSDPWSRLALLVLSCLGFALGSDLTARAVPLKWIADWPSKVEAAATWRPRRRELLLGAAAAGLALTACAVWWRFRFLGAEATWGALVWLTALLVAAVACTRAPHSSLRWSPYTAIPWLLFALALAPRLWNLAEIPYGVWFDEAEAGLEARRFFREGFYTPITNAFGRDASLVYYIIGGAMQVIQDPVVAGRSVAAIIGAANAPLLYFLGRELFGWRVGLAAGLLIAGSRWHLNVSRLGWDPIALPVAATLAFWLMARALRRDRMVDFAWAGMAIGLGLHGYVGYRIVPLVGVLLLVYGGWRLHWHGRMWFARVGLYVAGGVLVALPVIVFAVLDPAAFNGRLSQTLILNEPVDQAQKLAEIWGNVQKHALMFHVEGDGNGRHNIPRWPMLDPVSGLLSVLGLVWLGLRMFAWRSVLLMAWTVSSMLGGILTLPFEAPQAMRTLSMTPILALLTALGLVLVADRCVALQPVARWRVRMRRVVFTLGTAGVVVLAVAGVYTFFVRQMSDPAVWSSYSTRETIPARAAAERGGAFEAISGSATIAPSLTSALLAPAQREKIRLFDSVADLPYRGDGPALIFLETEHDRALADEVVRYYPGAKRLPHSAPASTVSLVDEVQLDSLEIAAQRGLRARYVGADGTTVERKERFARLSADDAPVPLPARVDWRIGLVLEVAGRHRFLLPPGLTLTVDGAALGTASDEGIAVDLGRGNHVLTVGGTLQPGDEIHVSVWPPGGIDWRPIDTRQLFVPPDGGYGLLASFYPNLTWDGAVREQVIDPLVNHYYHIHPFARLNIDPGGRWTGEWNGQLVVPSGGLYRFEAERAGLAALWLDGNVVFDEMGGDTQPASAGSVELEAGEYEIRVRYQNRGEGGARLYLYWTPPGGERQVIPGSLLYPPPPVRVAD